MQTWSVSIAGQKKKKALLDLIVPFLLALCSIPIVIFLMLFVVLRVAGILF